MDGEAGAGGCVLVVDDDSDWREILADQLESAGFAVTVASDGLRGWTRFLQAEPLVVVTDMQMPAMDGGQLLARVRARNYRVPVIIVTASETLIRTAELTGAYVVMAKSAEPDRIIAAVKAAVAHRKSNTPLLKLWKVAASLPRFAGPPASAWSAWWSARRRAVAAASVIVAVLAAVAVVARRELRRR